MQNGGVEGAGGAGGVGGAGGTRGRGRGSWQAPAEPPRELRRPHAAPGAPGPQLGGTLKTTLSAEAKEWFPPNYVRPTNSMAATSYGDSATYQPNRFSVQNRLRINQAQDIYNFDDMNSGLDAAEDADLKESIMNLINVMCEVTFCPGKFDTLCGPLVELFASTLNEVNYTRPLVDAIVNQSICEQNFRYNGARLCSMYDSISTPEGSTFRSCLLERCTAEENKIISGLETCVENMRGFAMFLAEIYTQLEDTQGGRVKVLGESLCKILLYMLDTDDQNNIKTVCQLLKLSGIALDADCPVGMHAAFERLRLQQNIPIVRNVLNLRANRWGVAESALLRRDSDSVPNGEPNTPPVNPNDSIYMPDGHSLTAEERAFLQSHLTDPKPSLEDEDVLEEFDNDQWGTGMDAEMQVGFLEFLKLSNQIKR